MGFLDHLWDETLAGPTPDSGNIGKRRAFKSLRLPSATNGPSNVDENLPISRSITVLRSNSLTSSPATPSTPSSPLAPTTPGTPFSPTTPGGNIKKLSRRKSMQYREAKSPTGYDWIVLSALDR
ncbi:dormancy-associated protein homolog 4 isoform X1 [Tanacetum coccineum]|uniref:Dormancy-associated protein homolog 4 isoform X1 n=1 Tax=Tanacetum coccineum TaxID=301880 RepID=A0ABQ4YC24_9ASTR